MLAVGSLALVIGSCEVTGYEVLVRFEAQALADAAVRVELALVPLCDNQPDGSEPLNAVLDVSLRATEPATPLGRVAPGSYGLYGRALSSDCRVVASGCEPVQVEAGGTGQLAVSLVANWGAACLPAQCVNSVCVEADGGTPREDAGVDSGHEPPPDAAEPPCMAEECCTGCWDGTACRAGTDDAACGSGGAACTACECPFDRCVSGECAPTRPIAPIGLGGSAACAIETGGSLWCWGSNVYGQLGQGDAGDGTERLVPTRVGAETDWQQVSWAGGTFAPFEATARLRVGVPTTRGSSAARRDAPTRMNRGR